MSVKLLPVNKTLVVERELPPAQKPDQFGFVLPDKVSLTKHMIVTLKTAGEGSVYERYVGQKLIVLSNMVERVELKDTLFEIVSENGVVGVVAESELF